MKQGVTMRQGDTMKHVKQTYRLVALLLAWLAAVTAAHLALNVDWGTVWNERLPEGERRFNVAYIPVT